MNILPYEQKFKTQVQDICITTADTSLKKDDKAKQVLLNQYCNYYIDCTPAYCFVAVQNGVAVGYILCSPDYKEYSRDIIYYNKRVKKINFIKGIQCSFEKNIYKKYSERYPAHLHIDILEEHTHKGVGSMLINALTNKLIESKIKGVMLSCSATNTRALSFYKKHNFEILKTNKFFILLGKKLY